MHVSTRVDERKKMLNTSRHEDEGTAAVRGGRGGGRETPAMICDPGSEVRKGEVAGEEGRR